MKRNKFCTRVTRDGKEQWCLTACRDDSKVPTAAWKALNKAFNKWKTDGKFFPLDELDAYQFAADAMMRTADAMPEVGRSTPTTYLVSTAYRSLAKYCERKVQPVREEYAAIKDVVGRNSDECEKPDVTAFVEALPGIHSFDRVNAMRLAAVCVAETLERLDGEAQRGIRAWLEADGIWFDAAKIFGCSRQWYLALFKHRWAPAFRRNCKWSW